MVDHGARLGIDFGSSHTVAVLQLADGRFEPLLFDASPLLPSAILADDTGGLQTGRDAERGARLDPTRFEPNPKRRINEGTLLLGDCEVPLAEAIGAVLARVRVEAERATGGPIPDVVLTHPANWAETRRGLLLAAARAAGFGPVRLVPEPVAAAAYFTSVVGRQAGDGASLVVYDLGGGTFDVTVVRRGAGGWQVVRADGLDDVGGLDLDAAVVDWVGRGVAADDLERWRRLTSPGSVPDRRLRRQLWEDARAAKEHLSRATQAGLPVPLFERDVHMTREELESLARPWLDRTVALTTTTLFAAGVTLETLTGVFLVGGASRMPLVATLLHRALGVAPVVLEQPELVVAQGALRSVQALATPPETSPETSAESETAAATAAETATAAATAAETATATATAAETAAETATAAATAAATETATATAAASDAETETAKETSVAAPRKVWKTPLPGASLVAAVLLIAVFTADGRYNFVAGARTLAEPTALLPALALVAYIGAGGPIRTLADTAAAILTRSAWAGLGATLAFGTAAALLLAGVGHYSDSGDSAARLALSDFPAELLVATIVGGIVAAALGLWLLIRRPKRDPLDSGRPLATALTWTAGGVLLAALAQVYLYDRWAGSHNGAWTDQEFSPAIQMVRALRDTPFGFAALLVFWLAITATLTLILAAGLAVRRAAGAWTVRTAPPRAAGASTVDTGHRAAGASTADTGHRAAGASTADTGHRAAGASAVGPGLRHAAEGWTVRTAVPRTARAWTARTAPLLLLAGGLLAAVHALLERDVWLAAAGVAPGGFLGAVHAAWSNTIGLVPPEAFAALVIVAFAALAVRQTVAAAAARRGR
ncbi:Hsp70 family protein [Dactylosporangium sp. CS-033363]|uniref:Hsp70 family protein n=1 Tax=Dactylosporangium sp. CS-033363 TaxID=3239935 RepID=UPI003D8D9505